MNVIKALKISIGCCLAITLANALQLQHCTSVVTITLLSILNTKKDTLQTAARRALSFLLACSIAVFAFSVFSFSIWGLLAYLFVFVLLCYALGYTEGLSMSTVLMLHLYSAGKVTAAGLLNEAALMAIGIFMGIFMNLYMPSQMKKIKAYQAVIDRHFQNLLQCFADAVLQKECAKRIRQEFAQLRPVFEKSVKATDLHVNNHLFSDTAYYTRYLQMRLEQYRLLQIIAQDLTRIVFVPQQAYGVSNYLTQLAKSINRHDNAEEMLHKLQHMRTEFQSDALPQSRTEFEARAVLYEIVNNIRHLLCIKQNFAKSLTPLQIKLFWQNNSSA